MAAGCGGGKSAEEEWAGNVCTDVANWKSQITTATNNITNALQSPGSGTFSTVSTEVQSAVTATRELATNLKGDKPPNGGQAEQQLNSLATNAEATATKAKQAVESAQGKSASEALQALSSLAPDLRSLYQQASSTLSSIQASSSKLKEGFDKAGSCKQFR
jgi:hypothetical protein